MATASSSNMFAITSSFGLSLRAITSTTMASTNRSRICRRSATPSQRSSTTISTCSRISLKPLLIAANCESLRNRRSPRRENAFRASSSITLGSSPSCMRSRASHTLRPAIPFPTAEIHPAVIEALGCAPEHYTLASLRYDISKLRAKGLVAKLPNSRRYHLLPQGYSICLVFLKLFERVYAPLTAGLLSPVKAAFRLESQRRSQLDRLYQRVIDDLDTLVRAVGLKAA